MKQLHHLLQLLSDGRFHSGEALGRALGISRANIWHTIKGLSTYGLEVESLKGRGYRLTHPLQLLDSGKIMASVRPDVQGVISGLELFDSLDSTNDYLMQRAAQGAPSGSVCLAEYQSAGKGRRGRNWISPFGSNLYLSLLWHFSEGLGRLGGLSLVMAVAVADAMVALGAEEVTIKWPNDLVSTRGKLGGILLEMAGETNGPCHMVVGVGLNIGMPESAMVELDQPWSNLIFPGGPPSRNEITAALINHLVTALREFQQHGLAFFLPRWSHYDCVNNREVKIHFTDRSVTGIARGVDEQGCLIVEHDGQRTHYSSGEVSLRLPQVVQ